MKRFLAALALSLGLSLLPLGAQAESIQSIATDVVINQQGQARFQESISYDLPSGRHGIYRDIPISTQISEGKYLNYDLLINAITRAGANEPYQLIGQGAYQRLKIGSASKTLSGVQTYVIDYTLSPFVRKDPAGDYLSVNLHGTNWDFSAQQATGSVTLPDGVKIADQKCYTGPQGSRESNCTITPKGENAVEVRANDALPPNSGLTVDLIVPANSFGEAAYITPSDTPKTVETPIDWGALGLMIAGWTAASLAAIFVLFRIIRSSIRRKRQQKEQTIVAQYEPPEKMLPGEVGLIHDEVSSTTEITATLIDLARRGHLKIAYEEKKQLIGTKQRFLLTKLDTTDRLVNYERLLLDGIFATTPSIYVDQLQPATMSTVVEHIRKELEARMKERGWYRPDIKLLDVDHLSPAGYKEWAKVEGLKLYLEVVEKDRMAFAEAPAKTPERFTMLLPYAIALGVEKQWAKQFEGIDITSATENWYVGNNLGNSLLLTSMLSDSFATSVSSNFSPPSSSGGAGGGFSGGGGGGGGGGSW